MSADWDINTTFAFWSLVVGVLGTGLAVWAFLPGWQDYQAWLKADPDYRKKIAASLRHPRWVALYQGGLAKGLAWLDRRFGEADSARALGICTVISLCYAWAAFFLSYGMGASGRLGEMELLPSEHGAKDRVILVALAVFLPAPTFLLGHWLGGWADRIERRTEVGFFRRRDYSTILLHFKYQDRQATAAMLTVLLCLVLIFITFFMKADDPLSTLIRPLIASTLFAGASFVGILAARRISWPLMKGPVAAAVSLVSISALALAGPGAKPLAGVVAGILTGAAAGAVVMPLAGEGALVLPGAGAIGAIVATRWAREDRRGAFAGGVGLMIYVALIAPIFDGRVDDEFSILIITFFLLLPLANGLWDWLSWWVSRWLGRDLLRRLQSGEGQVWAIVGHCLLDLVVAVALLVSITFVLAFGVEGYNQFAEFRSGSGVYDLAAFVREAAEKPWTEGFWLTAMLLSTLVPTFLHFALLLASPLALASGNAKRAELAMALEGYDTDGNQERILQNVGWHLARTQYLAWAGAAALTVALLGLVAGFVRLIHQGGLADYVAEIAIIAIRLARWLF